MSRSLVTVLFACLLQWGFAAAASDCPAPNGYFPDPTRCDKFLECRDGVGEEQTCPDGLLVNVKAAAFRYPCDYPVDTDCGSRTQPPASPANGNCLRRWGMFKAGQSCGEYVNCVDGREYQFKCPEGLAWHPDLWRCDWPDLVPTCNAEEYLGFKCPAVDPSSLYGDPRYPHPSDCARFFVCIGGVSPRLHVCGPKTVFNPETNGCDDAANVSKCANYYSS